MRKILVGLNNKCSCISAVRILESFVKSVKNTTPRATRFYELYIISKSLVDLYHKAILKQDKSEVRNIEQKCKWYVANNFIIGFKS